MKYSIIIPVYNRPDETNELICSLSNQTVSDFEVIVVEDGSSIACKDVVSKYFNKLKIQYLYKDNEGPGLARNYGAQKAQGEYLLILDSDVVLPQNYLAAIDASLIKNPSLAFGGPDRSNDSFSDIQKAINYSMTSFFTTGGIRGGKKKIMKFYPRSFNMGIQRELFNSLGGFSKMRVGEDMDLSMRIFESGHKCTLYQDAWVWHKRRTNFRQFFRQTNSFGKARIFLEKLHPGTTKIVHLLPAAFTIGVILLLTASITFLLFGKAVPAIMALTPIILYIFIIFIDSLFHNKNIKVALLSIPAAFVQLTGYGTGFIMALIFD